MAKDTNRGTEVIGRTSIFEDGTGVRGKVPSSVAKALHAKAGDMLIFERRGGDVLIRKSTAAERKPTTTSSAGTKAKKGSRK